MSKTYLDRPIRRWGLSWKQRNPRKSKPNEEFDRRLAEVREQDRIDKQNAETWEHPEAAEQRQLIEAKYGERPASIADYWKR